MRDGGSRGPLNTSFGTITINFDQKTITGETCRAAVFRGVGIPLSVEEFSLPSPAAGEALVRVECCTICGSDLHSIQGRRSVALPTILGHEILGRIAHLPEESPPVDVMGRALSVGDRVIWSVAASCEACDRCRRGLPHKCRQLFKYGHERADCDHPLSGGLAEYCHLKRGTAIVRVTDDLPDAVACPASCATATVVEAMQSIPEIEGRSLLIFGAGMLGTTAAAMARSSGATAVVVCDVDADRLARSRDFGATHLLPWNADREKFQAELFDVVGSDGVDAVLELSGSEDAAERAAGLLQVGGELVLVGSVKPSRSIEVNPESIVRGLLRISGVHNYAPHSLQEAIVFLAAAQGEYPFESLVERTFALSEINAAIDAAIESKACRIAVRP